MMQQALKAGDMMDTLVRNSEKTVTLLEEIASVLTLIAAELCVADENGNGNSVAELLGKMLEPRA